MLSQGIMAEPQLQLMKKKLSLKDLLVQVIIIEFKVIVVRTVRIWHVSSFDDVIL